MPAPSERSGLRSVKIGETERGAYSSDRTRRGEPVADAGERRPEPVRRARGRRLSPSNRLSYAPASLIVLAGAAGAGASAFANRLFEKGSVAVLSLERTRRMIPGDEQHATAQAMSLVARVARERLRAGQAVVVDARALEPAERRELVLVAQAARRPVHLIFLEASRDQLSAGGATEGELERYLPLATELRRAIEQGELGEEGFATVLTLTPRAAEQVRQIGFDLDLRAGPE